MTVAWLTINLFESYPYHKFAVMLEVELLQLVSGVMWFVAVGGRLAAAVEP